MANRQIKRAEVNDRSYEEMKSAVQKRHNHPIKQLPDGRYYTYVKGRTLKYTREQKLIAELDRYYAENDPQYIGQSATIVKFGQICIAEFEAFNTNIRTAERYRYSLNYLFGDTTKEYVRNIAFKPYAQVTRKELYDFLRGTMTEPKLTKKAWYNHKMFLNALFALIKVSLPDAVDFDSVYKEVAKNSRSLFSNNRGDRSHIVPYTYDEIQKLRGYLSTMFYNLNASKRELVLTLALYWETYLGLRAGEIAVLKNSDFCVRLSPTMKYDIASNIKSGLAPYFEVRRPRTEQDNNRAGAEIARSQITGRAPAPAFGSTDDFYSVSKEANIQKTYQTLIRAFEPENYNEDCQYDMLVRINITKSEGIAKDENGRKRIVQPFTKTGLNRTVYLTGDVFDNVTITYCKGYPASGYIFDDGSGRPICAQELNRYLKKVSKLIGIRPLCITSIRAFVGTRLSEENTAASAKLCVEWMGHTNARMLIDNYIDKEPMI